MNDAFFKQLTPSEETDFRQWAKDNFDASKEADPCWHPCVRDEWQKLARNDVGYFFFVAQTGVMSKARPLVSNYYVYRLPNLLTGTVANAVEQATVGPHGLQYKHERDFLEDLKEYDTEETLEATCEKCSRHIPEIDIKIFQDRPGNFASLPNLCEDCEDQ